MAAFGLSAIALSSSDVSAPQALTRFSYSQYHMGIDAKLVVYAPSQEVAERACTAAFARIAELDSIMSDYRVDSELNRLCTTAGGPPVHVSRDLFLVLWRAQQVAELSGGAFDITASPIIRLWRETRKTGVLPDPAAIAKAKKVVGWQNVSLDPIGHRVRLAIGGMRLDLGGIAKGYAGDEAQKVLAKHGIRSALVEMGGDIVLSDPPPDRKGWVIRVTNTRAVQPVDMELANCAVSTSGDTEQYVIIGGKRYSHVVDPRTGWALTNRIQCTVIAKDGLTTDPISTAITVMDPPYRSRVLRAYPGVRVYGRMITEP